MAPIAGVERIQPQVRECFAGGVASSIATAILNPMDVTKTRMQTSSQLTGASKGFGQTLHGIYSSQGLTGLWTPGIQATIMREMVYSSLRIGFYPLVRDFLKVDGEESGPQHKVAAALATGTIASIFANPFDVVKIRVMANPEAYPRTLSAFGAIAKKEGFNKGLMRGMIPSTARGGAIGVGEVAAYDHIKSTSRETFGLEEGFALHVVSSLITGVVATTVAAPFDIIKTRYMNDIAVGSNRLYRGKYKSHTYQ
eukprot:gene18041-21487_t